MVDQPIVMTAPTEEYLDCTGLACPLPIVRISRAMKAMSPGMLLRIDASDAAFPADLEAWISGRTDTLVSLEIRGERQSAVIQKGVPA